MSLIVTIKAEQLQARKTRESVKALLLTTLIGECETLAKNSGHELTDAQVVAVIKKFVKNIEQTLDAIAIEGGSAVMALQHEKNILESFLPKQMTEEELRAVIIGFVREGKDMGDSMKALKTMYAGTYDGAQASKLLKEMLK